MKDNENWYCKLCNNTFQGNRIRHLKDTHNANKNRHTSRYESILEVLFTTVYVKPIDPRWNK